MEIDEAVGVSVAVAACAVASNAGARNRIGRMFRKLCQCHATARKIF